MAGEQKSQYFTLEYSGTSLGKIKNIGLNIDGKEINVSNFDSGVFEEFLKGRNNVTMDVTCIYDQTDTTAQGAVIDDLLANAVDDTIAFAPASGASGDITYSGSGFPKNAAISGDDDEAVEVTYTFRINGTLTKSTAT